LRPFGLALLLACCEPRISVHDPAMVSVCMVCGWVWVCQCMVHGVWACQCMVYGVY
jgi:hypothetical protein